MAVKLVKNGGKHSKAILSDKNQRFQYIVDGEIRIADPYSSMILEPDFNEGIPPTFDPNLPIP